MRHRSPAPTRALHLLAPLALTLLAAPACTPVGSAADEFRPEGAPPPMVTPDDVARSHITARDVDRHIAFLASDQRRGRATPSEGLTRSAAWLATAFQEAGLEPAGDDGGYLQYWPYERVALAADSAAVTWESGALEYGRDFAALPSEEGGSGPLVWLGLAQDAPDSMDVARNRVAVTLLQGDTPDRWRWPITVRRSLITAARAGARGVVFVLDPAFDTAAIRALATQFEIPAAEPHAVPLFFVRRPAAAALIADAGGSLESLVANTLGGDRRPVRLAGTTARLAAPARALAVEVPNAVARLPGSDPGRAGEYVLLMAHYDHLGVGDPDEDGDSIYNGADDNASGVAALVEVAQAFGAMPEPPARPVLFLAVSGEEHGLLGATWFATNPTVFLSDAVAALNMDMVGRNHPDSIAVVGHGHSTLGTLFDDIVATTPGLRLAIAPDPGQDLFQRSDHFAFARRGVPAVNVFSGLHDDYHRPSDEAGAIDDDKVARVARLVFLAAYRLASSGETPEWTESGRAAIRR